MEYPTCPNCKTETKSNPTINVLNDFTAILSYGCDSCKTWWQVTYSNGFISAQGKD